MEKIRNDFPVVRKSIYVNTAVFGPLYDSLIDWRQEHDLDLLLHGSDMREKTMKILSDTRKTVGTFFNCKTENIALVNNFSTGLNVLLEGLDPKRKILLLENDYPSVNWPFEDRKFDISYVKMSADVENEIRETVRSENIDVLAISLVQWLDGFLIDLEFIKDLKKEYSDLIIIADGTQFCGVVDFNFESSGIDVLGASAYKWLLAGYGNGFMLFSDQVKEEFFPKTIGFNSANGDVDKKESIRFAKKLEPGHLSCLNFGSLKFSLEYLKSIGMDKISAHNNNLSHKAKQEFTDLGLLDDDIIERAKHSTIFNLKIDNHKFQRLLHENVLCAQRGDGVRVGFHFYNNENDLNTIVRILKTA
ncbi:aminotransferase class V-fold PLP-dependent enzyme [Maribacter aestuarii]|uniref:aminotransferase class V-fold PLP-dependent enzyme n=1 Tax=Maribacter aestuarii TaxID=1130723 RepID=UPI00248B7152|nr:aminotransferase class V-fold PLP-dependent enzyme [Maribacter aestuarii]